MTSQYGGRDWTTYYDAVAGKPPRDTLLAAIDAFERQSTPRGRAFPAPRDAPQAIDLGCGEGRDTRELLRRGWRVLAIDPHPQARIRLEASLRSPPQPALELARNLRFIQSTLEDAATRPDIAIQGGYNLVNASFALPFIPPEHFPRVWQWIRGLLAEGGRFAGQFFGPRDDWAAIPGRSHHSREQVLGMLDGLAIERFIEDEKDGHDAEGHAKHWEVFHIVARRV